MNPTRLDTPLEEAQKAGFTVLHASGASVFEAQNVATRASVAVVFIGLTDEFESEGFDRSHLDIPSQHTALLEAVLEVQKNVVVVLSNGAPVTMPWVDRVPAILEGYLGGQAWGGAVVDLLYGRANPSGKLAETFPQRLEDTPAYLNFPGDHRRVEYREGVFVGYRHYDAVNLRPLFPFGHGLSYTTFDYGPLVLDKPSLEAGQSLTVMVPILNSGTRAGAEVVQLYVSDPRASVVRPVRELKAFTKVFLAPGETKIVTLTLDPRAFAFWSTDAHDWVVEAGEFGLSVGASSRDLRQGTTVTVTQGTPVHRVWDHNDCLAAIEAHPAGSAFIQQHRADFLTMFGSVEPGTPAALMMEAMVSDMPLRNLVRMGGGRFTQGDLDKLLAQLNRAG